MINMHMVISEQEQNIICNALRYYQLMHDPDSNELCDDSFEDYVHMMSQAFKEDGANKVDNVLNKIATLE
tara:strand:- start:191 stop:400 length:210 start_codon:yes stop_codon:yes gene_type:complete